MKNYAICFRAASVILLITLAAFLSSCGNGDNGSNAGDEAVGTPVRVSHPVLVNMSNNISLNATTVFLSKEIVRATFQGFIRKIYKNIGDKISPGDKLFEIQTKELASGDTVNLLLGKEPFSGSVLIKAVSSGVLSELDYHAGDFVSDGERVAVISNPSSMRLRLNVPYEYNSIIKIGKKCSINLPGGGTVQGVVEKSVPSVNPETQTQTFYVELTNKKELPENLNTIVKIPYQEFSNTIAVPKSAVITDVTESEFWIMKLINDTTGVRVYIDKGIENDSLVQVLNPNLNTASLIISEGAYGLPDTARVEIVK